MGNSPPSPTSLRLSNGDRSYLVQLGRSAVVSFRGREVMQHDNGVTAESWEVSYKVGNSTCDIKLTKKNNREVIIKLYDTTYECFFDVILRNSEAPGLVSAILGIRFSGEEENGTTLETLKCSTTDARGDITNTSVCYFRSSNKTFLGLLVWEWKKRSTDEKPYTGTVAHYYVNRENGEDIGLSMTLKKIRALEDGQLDFAVDGPEQHPVDGLVYMFNQVLKTRTWKPTHCPHCAMNIIQRQRAGIWQSDSEDSDTNDNNVPATLLFGHGRRQNNGRGLLANTGKFWGSNNCNLNIKNLIVGARGR